MPDLRDTIPLDARRVAEVLTLAGYARGADYAADIARACTLAALTTPLRLAHFLAQLVVESDRFRAVEEYASGDAYEGRASLGNNRPGDGRRFKGRGLIQTTGRDNYARFTRAVRTGFGAFPPDPDAPDFAHEPATLAARPWSVISALYYWHAKNLVAVSDEGDTVEVCRRVSRAVNRGRATSPRPANHEAERIEAFRRIMAAVRRAYP